MKRTRLKNDTTSLNVTEILQPKLGANETLVQKTSPVKF